MRDEEGRLMLETHSGVFNTKRVKMLVYGESGVGKTRFGSTWDEVVFLDIDGGLDSVKLKVGKFGIELWEDLEEAFEFIEQSEHGYKTVVVDSLNELQEKCMEYLIRKFPAIRRAYQDLPSQSDYGYMLHRADKMVRDLKSLPMNVIFVAQSEARQYETDPIVPQLVGKKTARNYCRMMDIVGFMDKSENAEGETIRVMTFDGQLQVTKDRSDALPQIMEGPTYEQIMSFWA